MKAMKAKELAEKLLQYPDFEVLIPDFDNVKNGEKISLANIDWRSYRDDDFDIWEGHKRIYLL